MLRKPVEEHELRVHEGPVRIELKDDQVLHVIVTEKP